MTIWKDKDLKCLIILKASEYVEINILLNLIYCRPWSIKVSLILRCDFKLVSACTMTELVPGECSTCMFTEFSRVHNVCREENIPWCVAETDGEIGADAQESETFLIQREPGNIRWTDEIANCNIMLKNTLMVVNSKPFLTIKILKMFFLSTCFTIWKDSLV